MTTMVLLGHRQGSYLKLVIFSFILMKRRVIISPLLTMMAVTL